MRPAKSTLSKIVKGSVVSRDEANMMVAVSFLHNIQTQKYECTLCDGVFKVTELFILGIIFIEPRFCSKHLTVWRPDQRF